MKFQEHLQRLLVGEIQGVVRLPGGLRHGGQMNQDCSKAPIWWGSFWPFSLRNTKSADLCSICYGILTQWELSASEPSLQALFVILHHRGWGYFFTFALEFYQNHFCAVHVGQLLFAFSYEVWEEAEWDPLGQSNETFEPPGNSWHLISWGEGQIWGNIYYEFKPCFMPSY